MMTRIAMAIVLLPALAFAAPICRQLDIPGAGYTQGFQLNNAGQIAFGSDIGGFIYSGGAWQKLPAPPGYQASDIGATGINDYGLIAGAAGSAAFLYSAGAYRIFNYPGDANTHTLPRTVSDSGLVLGSADEYDGAGNQTSGTGFIYNPGNAAGYPAGFTTLTPRLPDGTAARYTILGNMNASGKFVGSSRFPRHGQVGFIYDPSAAQPYRFFSLSNGWGARPRGLNDQGQIAGGTYNPDTWISQGFFRDGSADLLITCPELDSGGGVFLSSLNNAGLMAGDVFDSNGGFHGLVVYPSVAAAIADLEGAVAGVGPGKSLEAKLDAVSKANAAGRTGPACDGLAAFGSEVSAQSGKSIDAQQAASFLDEAHTISRALGCK